MRHQRQELNECYVTVLAMLLDKPAPRVRRLILGRKLSKCSWSYLVSSSQNDAGKELTKRVEKFLARHLPWMPLATFSRSLDGASFTLGQDFRLNRHVTRGRGVIVTRRVYGRTRHIVAFENGVIFDSAMPAPLTVEVYDNFLIGSDWEVELMFFDPKAD